MGSAGQLLSDEHGRNIGARHNCAGWVFDKAANGAGNLRVQSGYSKDDGTNGQSPRAKMPRTSGESQSHFSYPLKPKPAPAGAAKDRIISPPTVPDRPSVRGTRNSWRRCGAPSDGSLVQADCARSRNRLDGYRLQVVLEPGKHFLHMQAAVLAFLNPVTLVGEHHQPGRNFAPLQNLESGHTLI